MKIVILYGSAGHGHQKAAESIQEGLLALGAPREKILVLDALTGTFAWFKKLYTAIYYYSVKHTPQMWGASYALSDNVFIYQNIVRHLRRLVNDFVSRPLIRRVIDEKPDIIISTHFLAPEIFGRLKEKGQINSYLVTVVTDFIPHSFWINPGTDHYWVMSEEGEKCLERKGVSSNRITAGGIPIALTFKPQNKKSEVRKKEGLDEKRFTLLITSGSFGLGPTAEVLEAIKEFASSIQAIVVCGRNEDQLQALKKQTYPFPIKLYGFVSHMDELMEASDLIIAKPGGATTSESLAKGIPLVVLQPIPGQEAGNARLLKERNAAFFLGDPGDIRVILKGILDYPEVLKEKKREIARLGKPDASLELARFVLNKVSHV